MIPEIRTFSRWHLSAGCLALCAVLAACSPSSTGPAVAAEPDLYDVWIGVDTGADTASPWRNAPWTPNPASVLTVWGAEESKRLSDPNLEIDYCEPGSPVGGTNILFPRQLVRAKNQIISISEGSPIVRRIYMDGRPHPEDLAPTYLGHSIGHWEGDVLVVDTVGVKGGGRPLNGYIANAVMPLAGDYDPRLPVTNELHLVERIHLVGDGEILETEVTLNDPKAYTQPFTSKRYAQRRSDLELLEYYCNENPREVPGAE